MGPIGNPETSVSNHPKPHINPEYGGIKICAYMLVFCIHRSSVHCSHTCYTVCLGCIRHTLRARKPWVCACEWEAARQVRVSQYCNERIRMGVLVTLSSIPKRVFRFSFNSATIFTHSHCEIVIILAITRRMTNDASIMIQFPFLSY
jgi:hypothetical protein